MFADLPIADQLEALFDEFSTPGPLMTGSGDVVLGEAVLRSHRLTVVAFDYTRQHGSIGRVEARQITDAVWYAVQTRLPLVFVVNTSGMRVTDGMHTVAALRSLLRALLDARLGGLRMFALVTRHAFGGASMISALCEKRIVNADSLIAMSGPKLIESIAGKASFDASHRAAVRSLIGGAARAEADEGTLLCEDSEDAYRRALLQCLAERTNPLRSADIAGDMLDSLWQRLGPRIQPPPTLVSPGAFDAPVARVLRAVLPAGCIAMRSGQTVFAFDAHCRDGDALTGWRGLGARSSPANDLPGARTLVAGFVDGHPATAPGAAALAKGLKLIAEGNGPRTLTILADTENHSADPDDERVFLSRYMAMLALVLRSFHRAGYQVHLIVTGVSGGGIFAALAAGASRVSMLPGARIQVLSPAALAAIGKASDPATETLAAALAAGAVDASFDC